MRDLVDAPDLNAFASNEGSTFTVHTAADAELVLNEVDTIHNTHNDWEQYTLIFKGPSDDQVESGLHRVDHPRLDAFDMNLQPVQTMDPDPETMHYQASFNRHVPDREPSRPNAEATSSRRGFLGKLAAALGAGGLFGGVAGASDSQASTNATAGSDPFIGGMSLVPYTFAPRGWAFCNGELLAISQYNALFSLIGSNYGGDGRTTFGLPNLEGRMPIHAGQGPGGNAYRLGDSGGTSAVSLSESEIPPHDHSLNVRLPVSSSEADATTPAGNALGAQPSSRGTVPVYSTGSADSDMSAAGDVGSTGGGRSHTNMPPYTVVHFIIALQGIYPSRN